MSVHIQYNRLFNLALKHNYYENGLARKIHLRPTSATQERLNSGRMLFKETPKGNTVLFRTLQNASTPFVDLGPDAKFTFVITADNLTELLNITDLDESATKKHGSGNLLYFSNNSEAGLTDPNPPSHDSENPEALSFQLLDFIQSRMFTYEFPSALTEDLVFRVANSNPVPDIIINETISRSEDGVYRFPVDLSGLSKGKYELTILKSSDDSLVKTAAFFADEALNGKSILGLVEICFSSTHNYMYDDTWEYALNFKRQTSVWKYFIVDHTQTLDLATFNLLIDDSGSSAGLPYASNYNFSREGDEPHPDIKINGNDTVIFKSEPSSLIPFFEVPKLNLQLKKTPADPADSSEIIIIENLPNPRHSGVMKQNGSVLESEIYVFV